MTEKKKSVAKTKTETTTSSSGTTTAKTTTVSGTYILNLFAFVAVCFGGVALFISKILTVCGFQWSLIQVVQNIAGAIAWVIASILSFRFIQNKKAVWMWVVWTIAIVMIIVGIIL